MDDVLRHREYARMGLTRGQVRAELAARRWQRPAPTVLVRHNGPLTRRQTWAAAVAAAGEPAALAAWTALEAHGLVGWDRPRIHVLVPRGRSHVRFGELPVRVHESRRFVATDVRHRGGLPRTTVERSAVDAAAWSPGWRSACGVLAACVQQRLTVPDRLRAELVAAGRVRRRRLLLAALADMAGGAQSVSEIDLLAFCRRHQLPTPVLQTPRRDASGRRRYLDASFRSASGREVHVEIDGALHLTVASYWSDLARANDLLLVGTSALRFPSVALHADDPEVVRQLRAALTAAPVSASGGSGDHAR